MDKKRRSLGVMIGGVHSYFPGQVIRGISEKAKEKDLNVFYYFRIHTKPFFRSIMGDVGSDTYDYQFNTIHDYAKVGGNDGIIIGYGTIGFHMNHVNVVDFAMRYNDRNLVIVTENVDVPNCHSIISNNYQGVSDAVTHLIQEHGCKKILFMRGPVSNTDATERYQGYLETMQRFGLMVDASMVGQGDFSAFIDDEVSRVLDANPDADGFVFSNDEMASSCYRVCEQRGIQIGKDLKVIGFDSGAFAEGLIPPLTSVLQDAQKLGMQSVEDLIELWEGNSLPVRRCPVKLVVRESCGCVNEFADQVEQPIDYHEEYNQIRYKASMRERQFDTYQGKSWYIPMIARDLNDCMENEAEFCRLMMDRLKQLKLNAAYLFLLDQPVSYDGVSEWDCPDNLYLASWYRNGESFAYQPYDRPYLTQEKGIAQYTDDGEYHQFMVFLLFSGDRQYGLLAIDAPLDELSYYYVLSLQLGLSLRHFELNKMEIMRRKRLAQDMEVIREKNRELDLLSCYDPLTGLMNLRGLNEKINQLIQSGIRRKAHLVFCDMDHLKQINDTWGHPDGDYAICSCAELLRSSFRKSDYLTRIGGDEFVCLALSDSDEFPEEFRTRLAFSMMEFNKNSEKPFYVEISTGIHSFELASFADFQSAIECADKNLYQYKKKRRKSAAKADNYSE